MFLVSCGHYRLILGILIQFIVIQHVSCQGPVIGEGQCIWYDQCDINPDKDGKYLNCKYDGEAKDLPHATIKLFQNTCPELASEILEEYGSMKTCCSKAQLIDTSTQLTSLQLLLKNCPACYSNLRKNFCYFACHPRHSAFLIATELYGPNNDTDNTNVYTVEQYSSYTYIDTTYESCEKVYFAPLNGPALSVLCGPWGAAHCTPERLFDYFGNNDHAPFNISYVYSNDNTTAFDMEGEPHTMYPFDTTIYPCNTNDTKMQCRCEDCAQACIDPPKADPPKEYSEVGSLHLYTFIVIILYSIFGVVFLLFAILLGLPGNDVENIKLCTFNQKLSAKFEEGLQNGFRRFTSVVAYNPLIVLCIGAVVIVILSIGLIKIEMTTDPVELWAAPESRSRREKMYYDDNFGPFYRTNQVIVTSVGIDPFNVTFISENENMPYDFEFGPVFDSEFMTEFLDMQLQIMNLVAEYDGVNVTLSDICIKPMDNMNINCFNGNCTSDTCLIESVMNYWQNDQAALDEMMFDENGGNSTDYLLHLLTCVSNPSFEDSQTNETCMGTYGGPVFPYVALGGFLEDGETLQDNPKYEKSTAVILTILGQNYVDKNKLGPALAWEKAYLDFLKEYSNPLMKIAFYSERSIEDEITREGKGDISTILLSYCVMFIYVAISLGSFSSDCNRLFIETKITLGLCSVILVFVSVIASIGFCAYIGVESTLFCVEVIPFLVLAVGVDNIFLLVQTWQREEKLPNESVEDHVARVVGKVAPSMLIATSSEAICFFLGALTQMPAVYSFSIYAGVAITIDFLLQITCLVALIVLDAKRMNTNRYDVLCCVKGPKLSSSAKNQDYCLSFFEQIYAPFLLKDPVRIIVILTFACGFCTSLIFVPKADIGLEQDIGMPDDSYVLDYFDYLAKYLAVGSPVYFVMKEGFNFPNTSEQNLICQSTGCNNDSILAQIFWSAESPNVTKIATGATSWIDSYFSWIGDEANGNFSLACCRVDESGGFINTSVAFASNAYDVCLDTSEFIDRKRTRPNPENFTEFLPDFLLDNPHGIYCPQAGHPAYGDAVVIKDEGCTDWDTCVGANNFMAYHTSLKTSSDFTKALEKAYQITDRMNAYLRDFSTTPDVEIFPYSIFYVYYEQYLSMWGVVAKSIGVSYLTVFLVMFLITGFDLRSSCINLVVIIMITVDIMGLMIPWNIQLNAISLVNLVMAAGISVEFCSHVTHSFAVSTQGTKVQRATMALGRTGSSVFSGITLTKFGGIIVLAFAHSNVIKVYYFRMYMMIVVLGAAHGLIFLPVLLSLVGPPENPYILDETKTNKDEPIPCAFTNYGFDSTDSDKDKQPKYLKSKEF